MKVNIEIDLSPKEARELMGWPDVSQFQDQLMDSVSEQLKAGGNENLNAMLEPFMAESQRAFGAYQKMVEGFVTSNANKKD